MNAGAGLPTGFAVPVLETGSPGPIVPAPIQKAILFCYDRGLSEFIS